MAGYDQEPAPLRYMSVPEQIQFTSTENSTSGTSYHDHSFMRVPETITLDDPHPFLGTVINIEAPPTEERQPEQSVT